MHELGIALEIAELTVERAAGARPRRVVVEVGRLTAVLPDALAFAWEAATQGSVLEGCALEIAEVAGRGRCRACSAEQALDVPFGWCACGAADLELIAGQELVIRRLELEPPVSLPGPEE
ncbi:MAG TPA: hydrogenase maturation nickel metallochaperone HypA [Kofleriaceae bacterium]|nr:hydrogenase maturation nickel metallochaperone HypA [Kofleriaceae bacterium]